MVHVEARRADGAAQPKEANLATTTTSTTKTATGSFDLAKHGSVPCLTPGCTGVHWLKDCYHIGAPAERQRRQALKVANKTVKPIGNLAAAQPVPAPDVARPLGIWRLL